MEFPGSSGQMGIPLNPQLCVTSLTIPPRSITPLFPRECLSHAAPSIVENRVNILKKPMPTLNIRNGSSPLNPQLRNNPMTIPPRSITPLIPPEWLGHAAPPIVGNHLSTLNIRTESGRGGATLKPPKKVLAKKVAPKKKVNKSKPPAHGAVPSAETKSRKF